MSDTPPGSDTIRLQLLLKTAWRNDAGRAAVTKALTELGIRPTQSGAASVSARISPLALEKAFNIAASELDAGRSEGVLPVSPSLREFVESITVALPHVYMRERDPDGGGQS